MEIERDVYQTKEQLRDVGDWVFADLGTVTDPKLAALKEEAVETKPDVELLKRIGPCRQTESRCMRRVEWREGLLHYLRIPAKVF